MKDIVLLYFSSSDAIGVNAKTWLSFSIQIKALSKTLEKHNLLDKNALAAIVEIPSNSTNTTLMDAYGGLQ